MEIMDPIRSWGEPLIDEWAEKLGAKCESLLPFPDLGIEYSPVTVAAAC